MKIVRQNQANRFENSPSCTAIEYSLDDKDMNMAIVELDGRYPNEGRAVNLKCKEIAYIIQGSGSITIEGNETELNQGDMLLIEPGEKYFWTGKMKMAMPCTPAWTPEQHKEIE